jgi:PadR family transcriptional regulator PadR
MKDLVKGDIPTLILAVLSEGPQHGYAIGRRIEEQSQQKLRMREGALYPALRVLEEDGFVTGEWEVQPSGPARKVYRITAEGHAELAKRAREWADYVRTMQRIMGGNLDGQHA